ncbi:aminotransferase class I/II-fold pyridoxal phosphate-dependent enzyme [Clostridium sediminicola]|uniref:aminotransferase class I/II-fold pyridoxal phosphate-dependent enzyme n=1 Tax=Clostridium sediminicola TaxID=3114879 RepID=UPI0031F1C877
MKNQYKTPLFTALKNHSSKQTVQFDVPGHKQGKGIPELTDYFGNRMLRGDINSMHGMDNLLNPQGIIREAEELAAELFNSDAAFFIVNGTTSAVQTMILASCQQGDSIIIPRNAHKSVINALIICGAIPIYVQPIASQKLGLTLGVTEIDYIETIKNHPEAKAVLIINPTYYGFVCDIEKVVKVAHESGMLALADEAHGTHFYFHEELPKGAISVGADMAALSLHKTGGSLTQSSILLLNERRLKRNYIKTIVNLTQTTSASYLLMSSLDVARKQLAVNGREMYQQVISLTEKARESIKKMDGYIPISRENIEELLMFDYDITKLVVNVKFLDITGIRLSEILAEKYDIYAEFGDADNILFIVGIGTTDDNINKLIIALSEIKENHCVYKKQANFRPWCKSQQILSPREAFYSPQKKIKFKDSIGRISGEFVMFYPPGIPILAPGELISEESYNYIRLLLEENATITGIEDRTVETINIIDKTENYIK